MPRDTYSIVASRLRSLPDPGQGDPHLALVQAATLAASSHNTQPWLFAIAADSISISPDFSRKCAVVDPDDSHLYKSLGCAAENLAAAASVYGFAADIDVEPQGHIVIRLSRTKAAKDASALHVVAARQCTRLPYDVKKIAASERATLEAAGTSVGIRTLMLEDVQHKESILGYVNEGNRLQLTDPDFRDELIRWIRFNDASAIASGDGLAGRPSGQPQVPTWLAKPLMRFALTAQSQIAKDTRNLRSSAGIAVFVGEGDDVRTWIEIGRAYERFALAATRHDIRTAFINQPIEVRLLRPQLHATLGLRHDETAHLMVRYGYGPLAPYSLRRPIADVRIA